MYGQKNWKQSHKKVSSSWWPGFDHEYFQAFESFFPKESIEFYYYDQLGSEFSDKPKDESLWTIDRFVDEVEQVRQALKLNSENFIILGHSWEVF